MAVIGKRSELAGEGRVAYINTCTQPNCFLFSFLLISDASAVFLLYILTILLMRSFSF